jgi:hypothetical protein
MSRLAMYQNREQRARIARREAMVQKRARAGAGGRILGASASPRRPCGILPEA